MNCRIITTVLATWMTFTGIITATPLPGESTIAKCDKIETHLYTNKN